MELARRGMAVTIGKHLSAFSQLHQYAQICKILMVVLNA
jgi:hypothetical protein